MPFGFKFQWPVKRKLAMPSLFTGVPEAKDIIGDIFTRDMSRYELYEALEQRDAELYSALKVMGTLVSKAYQGPMIHVGKDMSRAETKALEYLEDLSEDLNIRGLAKTAIRHILRDGDLVVVMNIATGVQELIALPMSKTTAVQQENEINQGVKYYLRLPNIYIYGENTPDIQQWPSSECLHFSLDPLAQMITDNMKRSTLGIWSLSPLESLKADELWKLSSKVNDMLWRRVNVPRIHWKLDLTAFNPDQQSGSTPAEKLVTAKTAAQTEINTFASSVKSTAADQAVVTGKDTEAEFLEPRTASYTDPNNLITQLNKGIYRTIGVQEILEERQSYASSLVGASFTGVSVEDLCDIVRRQLKKLFQAHLKSVWQNIPSKVYKSVDAKFQLILWRDMDELVRQIAVLYSTGCWTRTELREMRGDAPLTNEQLEDLPEPSGSQSGIGQRTVGDVTSGYVNRTDNPDYPETPESRNDRQAT